MILHKFVKHSLRDHATTLSSDSQPDIKERLSKVEYSSRFALGMFYKPGTDINLPWRTKDFLEDPCLRLVSVDNKKRYVGR